MKALIIAICAAMALVACASVKDWSATGGSRSDGVVKLSYEYGMFEKPQLSEIQAMNIATARCKTWGYTGAEAFGGQISQCNAYSGGGCAHWLVTKEYQCTGTGTPATQ
jgi:hypothetical protein